MKELTNPGWIKFKGILFLLIGCAAVVLLLVENWSMRTVLLLGVAIWSFCRFYYFAFYVIQNYVDAGHKFTGLLDFVRYLFKGKSGPR